MRTVIIFFIILVANVGGALTPLGNPPLFVGFFASTMKLRYSASRAIY